VVPGSLVSFHVNAGHPYEGVEAKVSKVLIEVFSDEVCFVRSLLQSQVFGACVFLRICLWLGGAKRLSSPLPLSCKIAIPSVSRGKHCHHPRSAAIFFCVCGISQKVSATIAPLARNVYLQGFKRQANRVLLLLIAMCSRQENSSRWQVQAAPIHYSAVMMHVL